MKMYWVQLISIITYPQIDLKSMFDLKPFGNTNNLISLQLDLVEFIVWNISLQLGLLIVNKDDRKKNDSFSLLKQTTRLEPKKNQQRLFKKNSS